MQIFPLLDACRPIRIENSRRDRSLVRPSYHAREQAEAVAGGL